MSAHNSTLRPRSERKRRRPARPPGESKRRAAWTQAVFRLYGRSSVVMDRRTGRYPGADHAHHAIPKQVLEDRMPAVKYDPRLGVPIAWDQHLAHENGSRRIRHAELPADVIRVARELGFGWCIDDPVIYP